MTKENRIKLGKEWKRRILANKDLPKERQLRVPKGISLNHPYILEAEGKAPAPEVSKKPKGKGKAKDKEKPEEPKASSDDEGSKLANEMMGGK